MCWHLLLFFSRLANLVTVVYAWIILPLAELVLTPDAKNMNAADEELAKKDKVYDWMLYAFALLQFMALFVFLKSMKIDLLNGWEIAGRVTAMGLLCGTFGINNRS